jgi:hypothetical protein
MSEIWYRRNGGAPAPLPSFAVDEAGNNWTDLANNPEGREACGFQPAPEQPDYDPATQIVRWDDAAEAWAVEDKPEVPAATQLPLPLTKFQFIGLVQSAGGMTDDMLAEAADNVLFRAFWIKFQMVTQVEKTDPVTAASLQALEEAGYLPNGSAPVLNAWPKG